MDAWMPIETAPITATATDMFARMRCLVYGEQIGVHIAHIWKQVGTDGVAVTGAQVSHLGGDAIRDWGVTHWQPLPSPPLAAGTAREAGNGR